MGVYRPKKTKYWHIDFYYKGRRYRESSESTRKRDAEQLLSKRKYEIRQGKFDPSVNIREPIFSEFLPIYMEGAKHYKQPSTIERNYQFLAHLEPYVFDKPLSKIDPMLAETYKEDRKNQGASNATVNRERSFLKAVLNKAVKLGLIDKNPLQYIEPLPESNFFNRYLNVSETLALIDACNHNLRPMIVTAIHTGLRWGNIKKLKWTEIDLENSIINLGKSKNGELIYPLPERVRQEIVKISQNESPYIFVNPETNKPWENLRKSFEKAKEKAGIKRPFRLHDLRHSFASNLVMGGYELKTVQELLGHRNISTTSRYAHLSMLHKKKAVDGLFQKKRGTDNDRPSQVLKADGHTFHHTE